MKIAFLHSGLELTGSFTYAKALESAWAGRHEIFWINDGLGPDGPRRFVVPMGRGPLPSTLAYGLRVASYVREQKIDLLHAHSRRASLVAALASRLTGVPYVMTAHLRTLPRIANLLFPCWGARSIAICETIAEHLRTQNGVARDRIALIRNGIDLTAFAPQPALPAERRWITVLGRLSGKRWKAATFVLDLAPQILQRYPDVSIRFAGLIGADHLEALRGRLAALNAGAVPARVEALGHVADPRPLIAGSEVVIAAGRSLMESVAMGVPVVAVGEQASYGLLSPETFAAAQRTNFGDFPDPGERHDAAATLGGLRSVLDRQFDRASLSAWGRAQMEGHYGLPEIANKVESLYRQVLGERAKTTVNSH